MNHSIKPISMLKPTQWKRLTDYGIYVPGYVQFIRRKADENIIPYLTFSDLFPGEGNSLGTIKKTYTKFFLRDIVQWLSKINYVISRKYTGMDIDDYPLAESLLKEHTKKEEENHLF